MQTVIQTPTFLADAKAAGLDDSELAEMAATIAANPLIGDIIPGTGSGRKARFGGKGKSGGYRVITYYACRGRPCVPLALVDKGQRADISQPTRTPYVKSLARLRTNTARECAGSQGRHGSNHSMRAEALEMTLGKRLIKAAEEAGASLGERRTHPPIGSMFPLKST